MPNEDNHNLQIVKLMKPEHCFGCRFASFANVVKKNNTKVTMIRCNRGDCDNWVVGKDNETPLSVTEAE